VHEGKEIETRLTALFSEVEASEVAQEATTSISLQDLEERASARKQARRQEALFRSLVENSLDAILVSDLEGNQTYCNRACYDLFGYDFDGEEMEGLPLSDLWFEKDLSILNGQVLARAESGGWSGETKLRRRNGDLFDAYLTVSPVMNGAAQPGNMAISIRDISERKALEQESLYRRRTEQVQLVTEVSQEITAAASLEELYRRLVNVVKERLGYWHVQVFRHDPESSALTLIETCARAARGMENADRKLADARGTVVAAAASGRAVLIPDVHRKPNWVPYPDLPGVKGELAAPIKLGDQVLGVLDVLSDKVDALTREDEILLMDLTGQVAGAMQSARLIEEARFLHQFADAAEGIGWLTLEGSLFIYANPALCSILGESRPEDTFGKSILTYYPSELRERVRDEILPAAMREGQWVGELSLRSVWDKVIPTMQSIFLVRDEDGEPLYLANVVTDISEQKRTESAADRRIRQIACLNDIGRRVETEPPVPGFLQWLVEHIPVAVEYPDLCTVAVEFKDADGVQTTYGAAEAIDLPSRIVEDLHLCGEVVGRLHVSYTQELEFCDEDKTLMGDIARRVSGYVESHHLSKQAQAKLEEVRSAHQLYKPGQWVIRAPEPVPSEEPAQSKEAVSSDVGTKARSEVKKRSEKIRARERLRKLLRRVSVRLFILVLVALVLVGASLTVGLGPQAQGKPSSPVPEGSPAPTAIAATKPLLGGDVLPTVTVPSSDSTSIPVLGPMSTASSTPLPTASFPTPQSGDLVVLSPFPEVAPATTPTLPIPAPVQPVSVAPDAINIVVLGSDRRPDWEEWHTDAIHVVSVQRNRGVVSVISVPRDLYVYIPGFWMSRINFADYYGEVYDYEGGGPALVRDTLLYNLGIRMDYYVRTNFDGLIGIVDAFGGVDIPVHCGVSDHWPYPDENGEYPILSLEPGIRHMDGETALWYARTRYTTSVFSRERRQQQVLQALWHKARSVTTLAHVPTLWERGHDMVQTDLTIGEIAELASLAFALEDQNVRFYNIGANEVTPWTTPYGGSVFLPQWEAIQPIVAEAMAPMPEGRLSYAYASVEVWNGTPNQDWDLLATDRLYRAGFPAVVGESDRRDYAQTQLILFKESAKGTGLDYLQQMLGIPDGQVIHQPGGSSEYGFRLILGADYQTCPEP